MRHGTAYLLISFFLFASSLLFAPDANAAQDPAPADSVLHKIKQLYEEGSYLTAEVEGRRLLEEGEVGDTVRIQVEKYIAFSLIAQDKPQPAASHFWNILRQDSSFDLDPQLTSPKILSIFQRTRERFFAEHEQLRERQQTSTAFKPRSYRLMVFPGWEQLHQGRTSVGYVFLSLGAVSLLSTVYCDLERRDLRDSYLQAATSDLAAERYSKYNRYYKAEIYSAVLFTLTYIISEVEVFSTGGEQETITARVFYDSNHLGMSLKARF